MSYIQNCDTIVKALNCTEIHLILILFNLFIYYNFILLVHVHTSSEKSKQKEKLFRNIYIYNNKINNNIHTFIERIY